MRLAKNKSDARTHRTPKALHAHGGQAVRNGGTRCPQRVGESTAALPPGILRLWRGAEIVFRRSRSTFSRRLLASTSGLFPIASLPRLFRGARRSAGSGEAVAGTFAGSDGGFCAYPASTPARVVLLPQSSVAGRFPPVEALHSGPATSECDSLPLAVALRSHCSLLPPPLVDVGRPPAGVDMRRSLQLAQQSMCWPVADHNESVLELPSAVRRSKLLTSLISS